MAAQVRIYCVDGTDPGVSRFPLPPRLFAHTPHGAYSAYIYRQIVSRKYDSENMLLSLLYNLILRSIPRCLSKRFTKALGKRSVNKSRRFLLTDERKSLFGTMADERHRMHI